METTKFFVACMIKALDDVHSKKIVHRDIKPDNLVFDDKGYLRLTDFGISRKYTPIKASSSGTPGYMAPEIIEKKNYQYVSDFFGLGVIAYQCMLGRRPWKATDKIVYRDSIRAMQAKVESD